MTLLLLVAFAGFSYTAWRRWRLLRVARRPESRCDRLGERVGGVLRYVLGQYRMPRYAAAGWAHVLVFAGFVVLLLNSILLWVRGFVPPGSPVYDLWIFGVDQPLGAAYALLRDVFTVLVILGVVVFVWNRVVLRLTRLTLSSEGLLILGIIFAMMAADLVYEGVEIHRHLGGPFVAVMPFASLVAYMVGDNAVLWHLGFWLHAGLVLLFLNLLPYGKHFHILTVVPNIFARQLGPRGRLAPVADLEGRVEREETLGVKTLRDFSWKDMLDLYTCTECGRCSDQCPATRTGKLLSPKHLLIGLRDHAYLRERALVAPATNGSTAAGGPDIEAPGRPHGVRGYTSGTAPADAVRAHEALVPAWIDPEVLWGCTTCGACEEECPVLITYIDKIVGLRQNLAMEQGLVPSQLQQMFQALENAGNPYSFPNDRRAEWAAGLNVPLRSEKPDAEYLYWVGCGPSFDDRSRRIAQAFARLLQAADVDFAILGPEETCNGDPARRAGNEFLFQMLAQQNVATLQGYQVRKIVTTCPHCYNTLSHEYPDFGGKFEVVHHTELLAELLRSGRLKPVRPVPLELVYHDACYLGRHNGVYDAPRAVLAAIPGVALHEPVARRDRGMCCGAGGAQMWKEEESGAQRVNHARVEQLVTALPQARTVEQAVASACPFCKTMLTDGLADTARDNVRQLDVAEVLWEALKE
ncbi:MAG: (Fe-S)-binding protein [Phycisphaerales bacterium]|nr:(Fe-S)-binding protein [Phycisphaerales bacterium]